MNREDARELSLLLEDGTVIRDSGWRCVADVMGGFVQFVKRGGRAFGVIVDAETLEQVYPMVEVDRTATGTD